MVLAFGGIGNIFGNLDPEKYTINKGPIRPIGPIGPIGK